MANFYIDYENVHNEGLKGIEQLTPTDTIYLFYSDKADTLKIDVVQKIMQTQGVIKFMKIENGVENALDFQLITALICDYSEDNNYYIISRDKGYDAAIAMAQKRDRKTIFRCKDINMALKHQNNEAIDESDLDVITEIGSDETVAEVEPKEAALNPEPVVEPAEAVDEPTELPDNISGDEQAKRAYQSICTKILNTIKINHKILINYRQAENIYKALQESTTKMEFYHMLNKIMGRKDGSELYKKIKTIYKVLRGIYKASVAATEMAGNGSKDTQPVAEVREINLEGVDCERTMIEIVMDALSEDALSGEDVEAEAAAIVAAVKLEASAQAGKSDGALVEKSTSTPARKKSSGRGARKSQPDKDSKEAKENNQSEERAKRSRTTRPRTRGTNYQHRTKRPARRTTDSTSNNPKNADNK
ncbi:PIN domain-containing protein [uncultured Anaerovibrio sp.]|uniref:PIN domain-containing protein n=1 Tax=uncultured Anaerovibrio sp. TaxID=361586 RepID=UPI0025EFC1C1|nr:PIN domain-containing protein [uncultured Anaerovibrio sp.]